MRAMRWLVVLVGVLLPYLARLPGGSDWLHQFTAGGMASAAFIGGWNAVAWGTLLVASAFYRSPRWFLIPALAGFGFLGWNYATLDLAADAQAAIALIFIPLYGSAVILVAGLIGAVIERTRRRNRSA